MTSSTADKRRDLQCAVDAIDWTDALNAASAQREQKLSVLHAMLLRAARADAGRRSHGLDLAGPELDDIAQQAADDALVSICAKIGAFRGESKFSTWAYKFAVFEVGVKINRHRWRREPVAFDEAAWERLPARFGTEPEQQVQARGLVAAVRRAVDTELTSNQRRVFLDIVVVGVPMDVVVVETGSNRNALYKLMFDARRKLRGALAADGWVTDLDPKDGPNE